MVAPTAVEMVNTDCIRITNPNEDGNPDSINIPNKSKPTVDHIVLSRTENQSSARPPAWMVLLQRNIDQVKAAVQTEPQGSDLRMLLFTAAASNERYASTLVPLPPQFRATAGSGCQVERLRRAIAHNWPSSRVLPKIVHNEEELAELAPDDVDAWHLLHWLLLPSPTYPSLRRLSVLHVRLLCRILGLACPTEVPLQLISIGYNNGGSQEWKWLQEPEQEQWQQDRVYPRNYAFLGLPFSQVYRFLYTGRLDITPGEPIRLYPQLESALIHCLEPETSPQPEEQGEQQGEPGEESEVEFKPGELCWSSSVMGRTEKRAVIICQLPAELDEATASSPEHHFLEFIVQDSTTLKPCYLLVYDEPVAAKMLFNWPGSPVEVPRPPGPSQFNLYPRKLLGMAKYMGGRFGAFKRLLSDL